MKIGFVIKTVGAGAGEPWILNQDAWVNTYMDIRTWLSTWDIPTGQSLEFLKMGQDGVYFVHVTPNQGGGHSSNDFTSLWFYIPNSMDITGNQLLDLKQRVVEAGTNVNLLKELLNRDYPAKQTFAANAVSATGKFAYRTYNGQDVLKELIGKYRTQTYYAGYEAVFLVDEASGIKPRTPMDNLTAQALESYCVLVPPTREERDRVFGRVADVSIYIANQQGQYVPFQQPVLYKEGARVTLIAEKKGFTSNSFYCIVDKPVTPCAIPNDLGDFRKKVTPAMFRVTDTGNKPVQGAKISVNNKPLGRELDVLEDYCSRATVVVAAAGYEKKEFHVNLTNVDEQHPCTLQLSKELRSHDYLVRLKDGKTRATLHVESRTVFKDSPLSGYVANERDLQLLERDPWETKWKQRFIGIGYCIIALILWLGYMTVINKWGEKETKQEQTEQTSGEQTQETEQKEAAHDKASDIKEAISYLDENEAWTKARLEQYGLNGLFEDMNEFRLEQLTGTWLEKLKESKQFEKIAKVAQKCLNKGWEPRQKQHDPFWNSDPNDTSINTRNYINWLDNDQSQPEKAKPAVPAASTKPDKADAKTQKKQPKADTKKKPEDNGNKDF